MIYIFTNANFVHVCFGRLDIRRFSIQIAPANLWDGMGMSKVSVLSIYYNETRPTWLFIYIYIHASTKN